MKTPLVVLLTIILFSACSPSTEEMSNEHCYIRYSPELKEMAKDINQEVVAIKAQRYSGQLKYEIIDDGDVINVKYELAPEDVHHKDYCAVLAMYYQHKYMKNRNSNFQFLKGTSVKTTVKSDELPVEYSYYNLLFLCDKKIAPKDQSKIKRLVSSGKLPQESTFWLKSDGNKYTCYAVANVHNESDLISQLYRSMIKEVENTKLSKPVEYGLMDLDYTVMK